MQKLSFSVEKELKHYGICDASGAVALDDNSFIVATDEDNILRVYSAESKSKHFSLPRQFQSSIPRSDNLSTIALP